MPKPQVTHAPTAVLYARVSFKEQEKEGFCIPAQLKLLRQYATEQGFSGIQEYVDVEAAKRAGRTGFTATVSFFKKQTQSKTDADARRILLVEKTDRLYRTIKDWVTLDELDVEIHLVKENDILSRDARSFQKCMHGIRVRMAKSYIDNLGEEAKKGMRDKAEHEMYPSKATLWYRNVAGARDKKTIAPDPGSGPIVQRLFEWYATGSYSLRDVTKKAYNEGLRSRTGAKVARSSVHALLTNPIDYGDFVWAGQHYHCLHEPLITQDLFHCVQAVLAENGEVFAWMVTALKASHQDAKHYHDERVVAFQKQYQKLQDRLDRMYIDKLDGSISKHQFDRMSKSFRQEHSDLLR